MNIDKIFQWNNFPQRSILTLTQHQTKTSIRCYLHPPSLPVQLSKHLQIVSSELPTEISLFFSLLHFYILLSCLFFSRIRSRMQVCVFASTPGFFRILLPFIFFPVLFYLLFPSLALIRHWWLIRLDGEKSTQVDGSRSGYFSSATERIIPDCKKIMLNLEDFYFFAALHGKV